MEIINDDCLNVLSKIKNNSIDIIITDPPYGIGKERKYTRNINKLKYNNEFKDEKNNIWDFIKDDEFFEWTWKWVDECIRILRPGGYFISWFDRDKINFLSYYLKSKEFKLRNYIADMLINPVPKGGCISWSSSLGLIGIWIKSWNSKKGETFTYNGSKLGQHKEQYCWEKDGSILRPILHGKERLKDRELMVHPTQKPEIIIRDLLLYFSNENDVVLDPFAGTGTVLKVAKQLNRCYIGIEKEEKYFKLMEERLVR